MEAVEREEFHIKKRLLFAAAALAVLFLLTPHAGATCNVPASAITHTATTTRIDLSRDPRFTYINSIASGLSVNSLGRASCSGTFDPYDAVDSTITMTLQQEKDGAWVDIKTWSEDSTGSSVRVIDKGYYVEKGYSYRVITIVQIWDTDGAQLEKVACDSPISEY